VPVVAAELNHSSIIVDVDVDVTVGWRMDPGKSYPDEKIKIKKRF
jgi:hypothetical protein